MSGSYRPKKMKHFAALREVSSVKISPINLRWTWGRVLIPRQQTETGLRPSKCALFWISDFRFGPGIDGKFYQYHFIGRRKVVMNCDRIDIPFDWVSLQQLSVDVIDINGLGIWLVLSQS
jgi:hypothetical protein